MSVTSYIFLLLSFCFLLIFVILEFALRTSLKNVFIPPLGYGSTTDHEFAQDKAKFLDFVRLLKVSSREWQAISLTFKSGTLNIQNGWRESIGKPELTRQRVHFFGGSTVLCLEVRDSKTLPSCLQAEILITGNHVETLNRGISGATVRGNSLSFMPEEVRPEDIVIIYFGVNDAKLNNYYQKGCGIFGFVPGWVKLLGFLRLKLKLQVAQWIWFETVVINKEKQEEVSNLRALQLERDLTEFELKVKARGAHFLAILQPHIWLKNKTNYESALSHRVASFTPQMLSYQYSAFMDQLAEKPYFWSLSNVFEQVSSTTFVDWVHTNNEGNEIIAKAIAEKIQCFYKLQ